MEKKHCLEGKVITGLKLAADKMAILFETTEGDIVAKCDADCCSHTWVEHIELPFRGFPATVITAHDVDMPQLSEPNDDGATTYYGFKVTTDKGEILIDYRNESNGYYGGSLSWPGDPYFYGGVYEQNLSTEEWQDIWEAK